MDVCLHRYILSKNLLLKLTHHSQFKGEKFYFGSNFVGFSLYLIGFKEGRVAEEKAHGVADKKQQVIKGDEVMHTCPGHTHDKSLALSDFTSQHHTWLKIQLDKFSDAYHTLIIKSPHRDTPVSR